MRGTEMQNTVRLSLIVLGLLAGVLPAPSVPAHAEQSPVRLLSPLLFGRDEVTEIESFEHISQMMKKRVRVGSSPSEYELCFPNGTFRDKCVSTCKEYITLAPRDRVGSDRFTAVESRRFFLNCSLLTFLKEEYAVVSNDNSSVDLKELSSQFHVDLVSEFCNDNYSAEDTAFESCMQRVPSMEVDGSTLTIKFEGDAFRLTVYLATRFDEQGLRKIGHSRQSYTKVGRHSHMSVGYVVQDRGGQIVWRRTEQNSTP